MSIQHKGRGVASRIENAVWVINLHVPTRDGGPEKIKEERERDRPGEMSWTGWMQGDSSAKETQGVARGCAAEGIRQRPLGAEEVRKHFVRGAPNWLLDVAQ